ASSACCYRPWRRASHGLDHHRAAQAAADADRGHAALAFRALEDVQQVQHDARAGSADRMAERDRAAVDVELLGVEPAHGAVQPELLAAVALVLPRGEAAEHLRGEGLVDLPGVEVVR